MHFISLAKILLHPTFLMGKYYFFSFHPHKIMSKSYWWILPYCFISIYLFILTSCFMLNLQLYTTISLFHPISLFISILLYGIEFYKMASDYITKYPLLPMINVLTVHLWEAPTVFIFRTGWNVLFLLKLFISYWIIHIILFPPKLHMWGLQALL